MVFKPWSEDLRTPRHLLNEQEEDYQTLGSIPQINIDGDLQNIKGSLLIIPNTLKFLKDALNRNYPHESISKITITKQVLKTNEESEEFIEEEQLYTSTKQDYEQLISSELEIISYAQLGLNLLVVPHYEHDVINNTIIAKELIENIDQSVIITSITPGTIPFDQLIASLSTLVSSTSPSFDLSSLHKLSPPFFITGISASLISQAQLLNKKLDVIVLQSEGVQGYEKINVDSVNELNHLLVKTFKLQKKFSKDVDVYLHAGKNINNFGLYL